MPFTFMSMCQKTIESVIVIEKSVDAEFTAATTVEDVMCDRVRTKGNENSNKENT
jgi:hypothetical protein